MGINQCAWGADGRSMLMVVNHNPSFSQPAVLSLPSASIKSNLYYMGLSGKFLDEDQKHVAAITTAGDALILNAATATRFTPSPS